MKLRIPSVAYHEAGHAVAAMALGMRVTVASIETEGFPPGWPLRGGVLSSFDHHEAKNRDDAEKAVTAGLAGEQAELLWSEQKRWRRAKHSGHGSLAGDRKYVANMLRPFTADSSDKRRTIKRLKVAARVLLTRHWNSVEAVAARLAESKALHENEIERLVNLKS